MKIAIASDHAGFELKQNVVQHLSGINYEMVDLGAYNTTPSDYPDFAELVGKAVMAGDASRGILVCGSGVQRGTNENTNGLLRQYFPKKIDLSGYSQAHLNKVALQLNQRPRKTLGFETPAGKLHLSVASTH